MKSDYIEQVIKQVRFIPDHDEIRQELEEHIEDMLSFAPPMEDTEVESYVREQMGDPEVVGQALDKEHHVVLGWIWLAAKYICLLAIMGLFLTITPFIVNLADLAKEVILDGHGYENRAEEPIKTIPVNQSGQIDNLIFQVDEVVMYPNGEIELRYQYQHDYFAKGAEWSFCFANYVFDENGKRIVMGSKSVNRVGLTTYCQHMWQAGELDAKMLVIDYRTYGREFYAEIPLDWEVD